MRLLVWLGREEASDAMAAPHGELMDDLTRSDAEAIVRAVSDVWNGDFSKLDVYGDTVRTCDPCWPGEMNRGRDALAKDIPELRTAIPGLRFAVDAVRVEDAEIRVEWTVTSDAQVGARVPTFAQPPHDELPVTFQSASSLSVANGKVVEDRIYHDLLLLLQSKTGEGELQPVLGQAVLEQLEPALSSAAVWPRDLENPVEDHEPEARRSEELTELLDMADHAICTDLLSEAEPREWFVFDPGENQPYIFRVERGDEFVAMALRSPNSQHDAPTMRLDAEPGEGGWPERLEPALAMLSPAWRDAVGTVLALPDNDAGSDVLVAEASIPAASLPWPAWGWSRKPWPGWGPLQVASDGRTTVLTLTVPNVRKGDPSLYE